MLHEVRGEADRHHVEEMARERRPLRVQKPAHHRRQEKRKDARDESDASPEEIAREGIHEEHFGGREQQAHVLHARFDPARVAIEERERNVEER